MKAVVLMSGGLDSAICAYHAARLRAEEILLLHFVYGQRSAGQERSAVYRLGADLHKRKSTVRLEVSYLDLFQAGAILQDSNETDLAQVSSVTVPGRNSVFLACAFSVAAQRGYDTVMLGAKASKFTDCQPGYLKAMAAALNAGIDQDVKLVLPLLGMTRQDTQSLVVSLAVPAHLTWSCYTEGPEPCGKCGACLDRASGGL